jgi:Zn-dependent M28 family amino/carboxypeptidase
MANVLARLHGTGPETIIIGAHRDHFGRTAGLVFPGADDNASGTAAILEVSRVVTSSRWRPKRTLLFVSFSGEEKDLLGSRLYITSPAVPLESTRAMINIDHAGIGNGRLTVGVTGFDKSGAQAAGELAGLGGKLDLFGFFPGGDHVPFKEAGVPTVTVVSGGVHPHFHQPTDTASTIDPAILKTAAQYVLALIWHLAN